MQTFLPYPSFQESAKVLDNKRLNKQIIETLQIYRTLAGDSVAWKNHPAVLMWKYHHVALLQYGIACYQEWMRRYVESERNGNVFHKSGEELYRSAGGFDRANVTNYTLPSWLGNEPLHSSHRAALLYKDYNYYSQFGWKEKPAEPIYKKGRESLHYVWPTVKD